MKLVKQTILHFQDEKSDKIYEVELFQVQEEEYVVNFRYGRRGKRMSEGTKTVFPVQKVAAEKIFDDLVSSKTKKGYSEITGKPTSPIPNPVPGDAQGAIVTITKYIQELSERKIPKTNWKNSRIIWRAGELKIQGVIDDIGQILPRLNETERYSAIWYLGRIADRKALGILQSLDISDQEKSINIYRAALVQCSDGVTIDHIIHSLPPDLKSMYEANDIQGYFQQLNHYLFKVEAKNIDFLLSTYYLSLVKESLKEPMFLTLSLLPLKPNYWKYIRYIYKIAELVEDGRVLALLGKRIHEKPAYYNKNYWGDSLYFNGKQYNVDEELRKPDAELAFSGKTKKYFVARTIRRLRQAGQDRQEVYCKIATEILNQYSEADRIVHPPAYRYVYNEASRRYDSRKQHFHDLSHIPYIYYILFANGNRFNINRTSKFYFETEPSPQVEREDAYSGLWDQYPTYLVDILGKARFREAANFAVLALEGRSDLNELISIEDLKKMISSPFVVSQNFSLKIVRDKYNSAAPDFELIIALIDSGNSVGIDLALELILQNETPFKTHVDFVKQAIISDHQALHEWIKTNISENKFTKDQNQIIVDHTIQFFRELAEGLVAEKPADSLTHCFKSFLLSLGAPFIISLLDDEKLQLQLLAGKIINSIDIPPSDISEDIIIRLLASDHETVRTQGINLLGKLSDDDLFNKEKLIVSLASNPLQDLRKQGGDLVGRLANRNQKFKDNVFLALYPSLLENHEDEEIPKDIWETISAYLLSSVPLIMPNIEKVLKDNHRETHLMTEHLLNGNTDLSEWPIEQIALMGNHDMKAIREISYQYYLFNIDRIISDKENAIKIFNTEWEATKEFAFEFFDNHFTAKEWTPDLIIALCDNIRPDIQRYGTQLLGKFFEEKDGLTYLTKLSEHPDPVIQLYTTNYLDRFAFNNKEILERLEPYFRTILSAVNVKSAIKQRVIHFLSKQSMEGEYYGRYVANILKDLVGTVAVLNKEKYIFILKKIETKYDFDDRKIEIVPLDLRG